jgi:hypothetical protein
MLRRLGGSCDDTIAKLLSGPATDCYGEAKRDG